MEYARRAKNLSENFEFYIAIPLFSPTGSCQIRPFFLCSTSTAIKVAALRK